MEGARIGPYRVLGDLGQGGMGKVYLAELAEMTPGFDVGARVALKLIHPHLLESPGFFKRFLREAEIGRSVEQANVVRCFDCDSLLVDGMRHDYLVMEYVEGQTLRSLLDELGTVPEELCRHIGREIAKGLEAIHAAGALHRDLKPENVLITPDHVVKIMDLGVARLKDEAVRLSQTGVFVGSLEYAAPEQFQSGGQEADGRADLHALGVMLYELSTGQHPYRDDNATKILRRILDEEPRKVGALNPQLSAFFEEVVQTLAAKEPADRFASSAALLEVLEEGEAGEWWKARAKALRLETKRPLRRIRIPRETSLYGRDGDLAKLHALYGRAKGAEGQVLLLEGEAGIGKTRLVDEFVGRIQEGGEDINFLFGSYPPGGAATAAGAFSTAYREHFGEAGAATYLQETPILVPAFDALLRGEPPPKGEESLTKDSLQAVFVHATRALAVERPTVVLIDDLHFAPEEGRALFASLALAVPGHRILLVGTMRPGVPGEWTTNVTRLDHAEQRFLSRLGPKDLTNLLSDAFSSERLAEELAFRIAQKSDGNPFFAFEIIRGLREGQFITQSPDGAWVTTRVIQDIQVPSTVLDLVNARVAALSEDERDLLDVAACIGFEFDPGLVAEALGLPVLPALKSFGQIERRHRLIRASGRRYAFDHHQVQEALQNSLFEQVAEQYHAALAEALVARHDAAEKDPEDLDGALCVDLCEHFLASTRTEGALRYLDGALAHLEKGYLNDQALSLAERLLAVEGLVTGEQRVELLLRAHARLEFLGRRSEQLTVLDEALTLAKEDGRPELIAKVEVPLGVQLWRDARHAEARETLERALARAEAAGDQVVEAGALGNLGNVYHSEGRDEEALAHLERHLALAQEMGDRQGEAIATGNVGAVFFSQGRYAEARAQVERHLALVQEIGDRRQEAHATGNLGSVLHVEGRYEEAYAHYERHLALAREIGDRRREMVATGQIGHSLVFRGRLEEAQDRLERHLALSREIGDRRGETTALGNLTMCLLDQGRFAEARTRGERCLYLARAIGDRRLEAGAIGRLGAIAQCEGRYEEARRRFETQLPLTREWGDRSREVVALVSLGQALTRLGAPQEAQDPLRAAASICQDRGLGRERLLVLLSRGGVAVEQRDVPEAERLYREAVALGRELNIPGELPPVLAELGGLYARTSRPDEARVLLREVRSRAREMSAPYLMVLATCYLARLGDVDVDAALEELRDYEARIDHGNFLEIRLLLWQATDDPVHLQEAKRLLDHVVAHAPEAYRETMIENVRLHREIAEAWAEHAT